MWGLFNESGNNSIIRDGAMLSAVRGPIWIKCGEPALFNRFLGDFMARVDAGPLGTARIHAFR